MDWSNHIYINLEHRRDRRDSCEEEIKKLDTTPNRFRAIRDDFGYIGCALSHIKCIEDARDRNLPYICVFEDDIKILNRDRLKQQVDKYINYDFDVLLLGGNNYGGYKWEDDLVKVENCFTTSSYIIKSHYYQTWIDNLKEGLELLRETKKSSYYIDVYNHKLQIRDKWYLLIPIEVIQNEGYSDIQERIVDYREGFLNYKKR